MVFYLLVLFLLVLGSSVLYLFVLCLFLFSSVFFSIKNFPRRSLHSPYFPPQNFLHRWSCQCVDFLPEMVRIGSLSFSWDLSMVESLFFKNFFTELFFYKIIFIRPIIASQFPGRPRLSTKFPMPPATLHLFKNWRTSSIIFPLSPDLLPPLSL